MKTISIEDDLFDEIERHTTGIFSHSDVLRKLLKLQSPLVGRFTPSGDERAAVHAAGTLGDFIVSSQYKQHYKAIDKYLALLSWLHRNRKAEFATAITEYRRGNRIYFAHSQKEVEEGGGGAINAKLIPDSPFWALSTLDNASKRAILTDLLRRLAYPAGEIQAALGTIPNSNSRGRELLGHYV